MTTAPVEGGQAAAAVVDGFTRVWAAPRVEDFLALFTPDVRLRAPLVESSVGLAAAYEEFARLLYVWPSVHGIVDRWSATEDAVFIEWRLEGDLGGRHLSFPVVDRIIVRDGLIAEREMFADSLALAAPFLRSPRNWLRIWRSGIAPTRSARRLMRATTSRRRFLHARSARLL